MAEVIVTNKSVEAVVGTVDQIDTVIGSGANITANIDSNNNPVLVSVSPMASVAAAVNAISVAQASVGSTTEVLASLTNGAIMAVQYSELKTLRKFGQRRHVITRTVIDGLVTEANVYDDETLTTQLFSQTLTWDVEENCTQTITTDSKTGAVLTITHSDFVDGIPQTTDEVLVYA